MEPQDGRLRMPEHFHTCIGTHAMFRWHSYTPKATPNPPSNQIPSMSIVSPLRDTAAVTSVRGAIDIPSGHVFCLDKAHLCCEKIQNNKYIN